MTGAQKFKRVSVHFNMREALTIAGGNGYIQSPGVCGVCAPAGTATLKLVVPSFSSCFVMLHPDGKVRFGFGENRRCVRTVGHFGTHVETLARDKFAPVEFETILIAAASASAWLMRFAHLIEFPQGVGLSANLATCFT